jgi:hypothetical protein
MMSSPECVAGGWGPESGARHDPITKGCDLCEEGVGARR